MEGNIYGQKIYGRKINGRAAPCRAAAASRTRHVPGAACVSPPGCHSSSSCRDVEKSMGLGVKTQVPGRASGRSQGSMQEHMMRAQSAALASGSVRRLAHGCLTATQWPEQPCSSARQFPTSKQQLRLLACCDHAHTSHSSARTHAAPTLVVQRAIQQASHNLRFTKHKSIWTAKRCARTRQTCPQRLRPSVCCGPLPAPQPPQPPG